MTNKLFLDNQDIFKLSRQLNNFLMSTLKFNHKSSINIYPIPRGGVPAAFALKSVNQNLYDIVDTPEEADIFIDDIIDSGATSDKFAQNYGKMTYALINKQAKDCEFMQPYLDKWICWPWEATETSDDSVTNNVIRLLQFIGEDTTREGLLETPKRFTKALGEWFSGYGKDPKDILKVFEDGADNYDQMVVVKDIPIYSKCEHHIADIFGTATIAYIPNGRIVGLSKLSRLADIFARRLQVQERLTGQIADALQDNLEPLGVAVLIRARHMCMESRGLCQQGHHTITIALRGVLKEDAAARAEFMALA